jgi:pyruvate carboxylase
MSDIVASLRQVIQNLVAPDLKSHTAKLEALQKQADVQYDSIMKTLNAFWEEMRSEFATLRANNQAEVFRQMVPLSERVAALESRLK